MLFLATVLNYLDRQTLSICAPLIKDEFGLSNEAYGNLLSYFRWAYAAMHVPAGLLVDRFSVRGFYAGAVLFWSLTGVAVAWVTGPLMLAWTRAGLGLGEAFNWPCALRVTANVLPPKERSLGNGIFNGGTAVACLLAPIIITPIAVHWGWRAAFLTIGLLGCFWVVGWKLMTGPRGSRWSVETPRPSEPKQATSHKPLGTQFASIVSNPGFWFLVVAAGTVNPCLYFLAEWLVTYLHDQRDLTVSMASYATVPVFLGADLGNLTGGGLVKVFTGRGMTMRRARGISLLAGGIMTPLVIGVNYLDNPYFCIALFSLCAFGITTILVNWLACIQEVSFENVGLVMGLLGGFGCVVAALLNPYIGQYIDQTGNYHLIIVLLGILPIITLVSLLLFDTVHVGPRREEA